MAEAVEAEIRGRRLVVSLPIWQIVILLGAGVSVIGSVWLTTHDLAREVNVLSTTTTNLSTNVGTLGNSIDTLNVRVLRLEIRRDVEEQKQ